VQHEEDEKVKYETRLDTVVSIVSYIALQGEPFRGHDESETSLNKGNFLEFLDWYKLRNEEVRQAYIGCPKNAKNDFWHNSKRNCSVVLKRLPKY